MAEFGASTVVELGVAGGRCLEGGGGTARPEDDGGGAVDGAW